MKHRALPASVKSKALKTRGEREMCYSYHVKGKFGFINS